MDWIDRWKVVLPLVVLLAGPRLYAENLIPGDTSFETEAATLTSGRMDPGYLPVHWDDREAFHGKRSLRIDWDRKNRRLSFAKASDNWMDSTFSLDSKELKNGKVYTFSFYAKADREQMPLVLIACPNSTWWIYNTPGCVKFTNFKVGKNWQRYSVSFTAKLHPKAPVKGYSFMLRVQQSPAGSFWFDAFQLTEGDQLKEYQVSAPMNCGIDLIPCPISPEVRKTIRNIYYPGEKITGSVRVSSNDGNGGELAIRTMDHQGKIISEQRRQVRGGEVIPLKFDSGRRGWFKTTATISRNGREITSHSANFIVIDPPEKTVAGIEPFFGLIEQNFMLMDVMKRIGVKRIEIRQRWKTTFTSGIELEKGKYDFRGVDAKVKRAKAAGMKIKFLFAAFHSPSWYFDPEVWKEAGKYPRGREGLISPESMTAWKKLALTLLDRYGDDISVFELGAEDNGNLGTNAYYRSKHPEWLVNGWMASGPVFDLLYDTVAELAGEFKKQKPHIKVGIIRPSQGREGTDWTFIEKVFERIGKKFDVFPVDIYLQDPCSLGPDIKGFVGGIDGREYSWNLVQRIVRKYGKKQPVYISESGLQCDTRYPDDSVWERERAILLSKDFLTTRAYGFYAYDLFSSISGSVSDLYAFSMTNQHRLQMSIAAVAAAAGMVENTVHHQFKRLPGATRLCLFKKHDGSGTAAIWADRGYYFIPASRDGLAVFDMMGNPIAAGKDGKFPLGQEHILIRGRSYEKMASAIENGEIGQSDFCSASCDIQQENTLTIRIDNNSMKKDLRLEMVLTSEAGKQKKNFSVPAGGSRAVFLPFKGKHAAIALKNTDNNGMLQKEFTLETPIPLKRTPTVIAEIFEKKQLLPNEPWTPWNGPDDFSAVFSGSWNEEYLMLDVKVKDDKHFNKFNQTYFADSLQVAMDPQSNAGIQKRNPGLLGKDDLEIGIARSSKTGKKFLSLSKGPRNLIEDNDYEVIRDENAKMTYYKIRIPWKKMGVSPQKGLIFGMSMIIFDDDTGAGQEYFAPVGGGIAGKKDPARFLKFVLQ